MKTDFKNDSLQTANLRIWGSEVRILSGVPLFFLIKSTAYKLVSDSCVLGILSSSISEPRRNPAKTAQIEPLFSLDRVISSLRFQEIENVSPAISNIFADLQVRDVDVPLSHPPFRQAVRLHAEHF